VFAELTNWLQEYRLYRRDDKGHIVKQNDHLMDATRYLIKSGRGRMTTEPVEEPEPEPVYGIFGGGNGGGLWMG
jgi:hypothetical protein